MRSRQGSILVESIVVCLISVIVIASVTSILSCSVSLIQTSKECLIIERAREATLAELAAGFLPAGGQPSAENYYIKNISSAGSNLKIHIYKDGFKERRESFVLWPHKDWQE